MSGLASAPVSTALLDADGLRLDIDGRTLFDRVSLTVAKGERIAVTGPSGSGKTSLLAILAGITAPTAGTVRRGGATVMPGRIPPGTAAVLQRYGLVALLTAAENVEVVLRAAGVPADEARVTARTVLAEVGLGDLTGHLIEELSGGQRQRVAVARALASRPEVLIADEPTAEQDPGSREVVLARLFGVTSGGGALVLATHDPEVAGRCDRVISLRLQGRDADGRVQDAVRSDGPHRPGQGE